MPYDPSSLNHKLYTQSYFLIHSNESYMHSFGKRAGAAATIMGLFAIFAYQNWSTTLPVSKPLK